MKLRFTLLYAALFISSLLLIYPGCSRTRGGISETSNCIEKHQLTAAQEDAIRNEIHAEQKALRLDSLFNKKHHNQGFNGTVLIAQKGVILYEKALGYSDLKTKSPLDLKSGFQLASISKTFTGVATLLLVQAGKLALADSVQQFFPEFPYHGVSILDLLSHRSGLPNYIYAFDDKRKQQVAPPSNADIIEWFCQANPVIPAYNKPGRNFSYNNTNFMLLAAIIEKVSEKSFADFLKETIFEPLGMNHTYVDTLAPDSILRIKTKGHHGSRQREREFYDGVYGDKGIFSTAGDLYRWYSGLTGECLLDHTMLEEAFTPRSFEKKSRHNYGLGFRIMTLPGDMNNVEYIYHGGWWAGYSTMLWFDPKKDFVIIVLGNKKSMSVYEIRPVIEILDDLDSTDQEIGTDATDTL